MIQGFFISTIILFSIPAGAQCFNEDFESSTLGPLPLISTNWNVSEAANSQSNSIVCGSVPLTFTIPSNGNNAVVMQTPIADLNCNNVSHSPFGGTQVLQLNGNNKGTTKMTRVTKTFNVTTSNWFYKFAYKCVLMGAHNCCDDANVMFRFYDCSNNYLIALSRTLTPKDYSCLIMPTFSCSLYPEPVWAVTPPETVYNPDWVVAGVNLAPYIGSCVTVEVLASQCYASAHQGYLYYDAQCSANGIIVNNIVPATSGFTSCAATATLSGPACFSSYLWNGPAGSGISGSTSSVVTTSVSGVYSLELSYGGYTLVQTQNIFVSPVLPYVTIAAAGSNFMICPGKNITLNATGNNLVSYNWGGGNTTASVYTLSPTTTTKVAVTATNEFGCIASDTKTITMLPFPTITVNSGSICQGGSFTIVPSGANFYMFQGGSAVVTPTATSVYTVTGVNTGCSSLPVVSFVSVLNLPVITAKSGSICAGESYTLRPSGAEKYTFSSTSEIVKPPVSSTYTISGTDWFGCESLPIVVGIDVSNMPDVSWFSQPIQCLNKNSFNFVLKNNPPPGTSFSWDFTSSAYPPLSTQVSPTNIVFKEIGLFMVNVFAKYKACHETYKDTIRVIGPLPPKVNWDTTIVVGQKVKLNAYAGSGFTYTWTPLVKYLDCISCQTPDPVSNTSVDIVYTVSIEDGAHCTISQNTYSIIIRRVSSVDVPTAFTPNGDGINDVIYPSGWGIKRLVYFRVFNHWGQMIFESNDLKTGWDGIYNGVPQNTETYVYQVSVETLITGEKPLVKNGTFKLLR